MATINIIIGIINLAQNYVTYDFLFGMIVMVVGIIPGECMAMYYYSAV